MTMKFSKLLALGVGVTSCLFFVALSGCASAPTPTNYSLKIELDQVLVGSSILMDVVGANAVSDLPKWESYSVSDYWQPGNPMRRDSDKVSLDFGDGKPTIQYFSSENPAWQRWLNSGARYVVMVVDLPGIAADRVGNADARRLILPLDKRQWPKGVDTLELRVQESGIRLLTPMKAAK
jgi:hypothetical protein